MLITIYSSVTKSSQHVAIANVVSSRPNHAITATSHKLHDPRLRAWFQELKDGVASPGMRPIEQELQWILETMKLFFYLLH